MLLYAVLIHMQAFINQMKQNKCQTRLILFLIKIIVRLTVNIPYIFIPMTVHSFNGEILASQNTHRQNFIVSCLNQKLSIEHGYPTYVLMTNLNIFGQTDRDRQTDGRMDKGKSKCPALQWGHKKCTKMHSVRNTGLD